MSLRDKPTHHTSRYGARATDKTRTQMYARLPGMHPDVSRPKCIVSLFLLPRPCGAQRPVTIQKNRYFFSVSYPAIQVAHEREIGKLIFPLHRIEHFFDSGLQQSGLLRIVAREPQCLNKALPVYWLLTSVTCSR